MSSFIELEPQLDNPSSLSCSSVRLIIRESASHFQRAESVLDVGDEGYADQEISLSNDLNDSMVAFEKRPIDCLMTVDSDDKYECSRCKFIGNLSLPALASDSFE